MAQELNVAHPAMLKAIAASTVGDTVGIYGIEVSKQTRTLAKACDAIRELVEIASWYKFNRLRSVAIKTVRRFQRALEQLTPDEKRGMDVGAKRRIVVSNAAITRFKTIGLINSCSKRMLITDTAAMCGVCDRSVSLQENGSRASRRRRPRNRHEWLQLRRKTAAQGKDGLCFPAFLLGALLACASNGASKKLRKDTMYDHQASLN